MLFSKILKSLIPNPMGHKICVKPFGKEQIFSAMIGYVTKDQGQPSYHILAHNVSAQELTYARREQVAKLSSFDDNKKILNLRNIFNESFRFAQRSFWGMVIPIPYIIAYMIKSGNYILSPDFIATFKKRNFSDTTTLWRLCFATTLW